MAYQQLCVWDDNDRTTYPFLYFAWCKSFSHFHFDKACEYIENVFQGEFKKHPFLLDIDYSEIQIYDTPKGRIAVHNDIFADWVDVHSEFEINNPEWEF